MKGTYRFAVRRVVACAGALGLMFVPALPAASAATAPVVKQVSVNSRLVYTDTGLNLRKGQTVTIKASGFIHFGLRPIDHLTPAGMARISGCDELTGRKASQQTPRPAPRLDCWSLIGKIGTGGPFPVGTSRTLTAPNDGELRLGVNDNYLRDNAGEWTASVTISDAGSTAPVATPGATKKSSSSSLMLIVGGVLVVAVLVVLVVFLRKRRVSAEAAPPAPAPAQAWPDRIGSAVPPAAPPVIHLPDAPAEAASNAVVVSPEDGDFTDVNIFEVEFPDSWSLRVGYNHFPEGTLVRFGIAQRARADARGDFVTKGGGAQYHFVTVELSGELEPDPNGADVTFTWDIGGVPFQYSVRRVLA